jgi:hypothetical protein
MIRKTSAECFLKFGEIGDSARPQEGFGEECGRGGLELFIIPKIW